MKISIGINGFKPLHKLEKREQLCIESLKKIQVKHSNISLYNISYKEDRIFYNGFSDLFIEKKGKIPFVNDILDKLSETECDYFIFLNNDIIISQSLYNIFESKNDCYAISRIHLHELNKLTDDLKMQSYSVHGFDAFAIKPEWWRSNGHKLPMYYIGKPYWDTHLATICKMSGGEFVNKIPPVIFHVEHQSVSCTTEDMYSTHNEQNVRKYPEMSKWWAFVHNVLLKRKTHNEILWYLPFDNEEELERKYFS